MLEQRSLQRFFGSGVDLALLLAHTARLNCKVDNVLHLVGGEASSCTYVLVCLYIYIYTRCVACVCIYNIYVYIYIYMYARSMYIYIYRFTHISVYICINK